MQINFTRMHFIVVCLGRPQYFVSHQGPTGKRLVPNCILCGGKNSPFAWTIDFRMFNAKTPFKAMANYR